MAKNNNQNNISDSRRNHKKALRGVPLFYDEVKHKYNITLTPELNEYIVLEAKQRNTSKSELLEVILRQRYGLPIPPTSNWINLEKTSDDLS